MAENRNVSCGNSYRDTVCADINRIMDSCRDKDCFDTVRVFLTDYGQELISKVSNIRVKSTEILSTSIEVEALQFNKGFYQIYLKFYVKLTFEVCACVGKGVEIEGLAICDKKVILYGGEGGTNLYKSDPEISGFCSGPCGTKVNNKVPTVVVEVLDPISLDVKIMDTRRNNCCCTCTCEDVPENITCNINGVLTDCDNGKGLFVTLGFFSIIRVERSGQYLLNAAEYTIPEKECVVVDEIEDACDRFKKMPFPEKEFCIPPFRGDNGCGGCKK